MKTMTKKTTAPRSIFAARKTLRLIDRINWCLMWGGMAISGAFLTWYYWPTVLDILSLVQ